MTDFHLIFGRNTICTAILQIIKPSNWRRQDGNEFFFLLVLLLFDGGWMGAAETVILFPVSFSENEICRLEKFFENFVFYVSLLSYNRRS